MKTSAIICLLLVTIGCAPQGATRDQRLQAQGTTLAILALSANDAHIEESGGDDSKPEPAPKPGDKCRKCNGTGSLSGDGLLRCDVCRGDGRIDRNDLVGHSQESPDFVAIKRCVLYLDNGNFDDGWPKEWMETEAEKMRAAGYTVEGSRDFSSNSGKPAYFTVTRGVETVRVDGPATAEQLILAGVPKR